MATHAYSIRTSIDEVAACTTYATDLIRRRQYLAALHALRVALDRCVDERRARIADLMDCLGNARVAQLAGGAHG